VRTILKSGNNSVSRSLVSARLFSSSVPLPGAHATAPLVGPAPGRGPLAAMSLERIGVHSKPNPTRWVCQVFWVRALSEGPGGGGCGAAAAVQGLHVHRLDSSPCSARDVQPCAARLHAGCTHHAAAGSRWRWQENVQARLHGRCSRLEDPPRSPDAGPRCRWPRADPVTRAAARGAPADRVSCRELRQPRPGGHQGGQVG